MKFSLRFFSEFFNFEVAYIIKKLNFRFLCEINFILEKIKFKMSKKKKEHLSYKNIKSSYKDLKKIGWDLNIMILWILVRKILQMINQM